MKKLKKIGFNRIRAYHPHKDNAYAYAYDSGLRMG
jgi:hypothetical protein